MLLFLVFILVVSQVVLLLLSPQFRDKFIFRWYYDEVYKPMILDNSRYRIKFYVVPVFYLSVYSYMVYIFYSRTFAIISPMLTSIETYVVIPLTLILPLFFGSMSMIIKPDSSNAHQIGSEKRYPYDNLLYFPQHECRTCKQVKPARSKHCTVCNSCIYLADHHCVWINNCVGMGNYMYFYSFLCSNLLLLSYSFIRLIFIQFNKSAYNTTPTGEKSLLILSILCGSFTVILAVYCYFVFELVNSGMTTNEKDKWQMVHDYINTGDLVRDPEGKYFIKYQNGGNNHEFYSTDSYDGTQYTIVDYFTVKSPAEITNIYDKGNFINNLREFIG